MLTRLIRACAFAAFCAVGIALAEEEILAASCSQITHHFGSVTLEYCGPFLTETEAQAWLEDKMEEICDLYYPGTNASFYWWHWDGGSGAESYWSAGGACQ